MNKKYDEAYKRSTKLQNLEMCKSSKGLWETPDSSDRVPKLRCQKSSGAETMPQQISSVAMTWLKSTS